MRFLLTTAHPYLPEIAGGAQSSMHELATGLISEGHEVAVLAGFMGHGWRAWPAKAQLKLGKAPVIESSYGGYRVFRAWQAWDAARYVADRFQPDVVSPQSGLPVTMSRAFHDAGVATVIYFRNVEDNDFGGNVTGSADRYIANSQFTANFFRSEFGVGAEVILPMFEEGRYLTDTNRKYVTFINPHPHKGRDVVFELARRCPDVAFAVVKAWTLSVEDEAILQQALADCPNITLLDQTRDMRDIYSQTRLVIAPSQWQEAYGRIATEAHFSGIPVLASDIGGLPEAVGPGGELVRADAPIEAWLAALRRMLDDPDHYAALSAAALAYAKRPAIQKSAQIGQFIAVCAAAAEAKRSPAPSTV